MIRPFHRSLLFWLGLPGLLFLIWAWHDSQSHLTDFARGRRTDADGWFHWQGGLTVAHANVEKGDFSTFLLNDSSFAVQELSSSQFPIVDQPWRFNRGEKWDDYDWEGTLRPSIRTGSTPRGSDWWSVFIPHWLMILGYLVAWGGIAVWWRLRVKRAVRRIQALSP